MTEKLIKNGILTGHELRQTVLHKIELGILNAKKDGFCEKEAFLTACKARFGSIVSIVDWDFARSNGDVNSFPGNIVSALQYARIKSGKNILDLYDVENPKAWEGVIDDVLSDPNQCQFFCDNFWRSPMVSHPMRALPLQYLLPFHFGNAGIKGIDIGAGAHVAFPMLNSKPFLSFEFEGDKSLRQLRNPINLLLAVGVDKQKRDIDWARVGYYPGKRTYQRLELLNTAYERAISDATRFPVVCASVFEPKLYSMIAEVDPTSSPKYDFVFTSFIRHQLGKHPSIQEKFISTIAQIVREEGIWVDIGRELLDTGWHPYDGWAVEVYRMNSGQMHSIGIPFILTADQARVKKAIPEYFLG